LRATPQVDHDQPREERLPRRERFEHLAAHLRSIQCQHDRLPFLHEHRYSPEAERKYSGVASQHCERSQQEEHHLYSDLAQVAFNDPVEI
jgi:hypothetical protein